jgi:hypothetical protein
MTAEQPFTLVSKAKGLEVRHYPKYVLVQVQTKGEFSRAANVAFGPLVNYISGVNESKTKYAMTAPVIHAPDQKAKNHLVSFVLPENIALEDIPLPTNAQVSILHVPAHYAAAIAFRGLASYEHFKEFGDKLETLVSEAGLVADGDPYYARFDPPWKPGFLRRNEAIIALKDYAKK